MNFISIAALVIIAGLVFLAGFYLWKNRKKGGCTGNCATCGGCGGSCTPPGENRVITEKDLPPVPRL